MAGLANSRWAPPRSSSVPSSAKFASSSSSSLPVSAVLAFEAQHRAGPPPRTASPLSATAATVTTPPTAQTAAAELSRYTRIVRRMKWKLPFLASAYQQATTKPTPGGPDPAAVAEAELMFKLDYFEYYMLLERALVHLQLVFGIVISRGHNGYAFDHRSRQNGRSNGQGGSSSSGWSGRQPNSNTSDHRYHANVLAALDGPDNPLHPTLGTPDVRRQLARAKDLRNLWKSAEEDGPGGSTSLESYDLEHILEVIFDALDRAFLVAKRYVGALADPAATAQSSSPSNGHLDGRAAASGDFEVTRYEETLGEEEQWEFMVEAMDWEAV